MGYHEGDGSIAVVLALIAVTLLAFGSVASIVVTGTLDGGTPYLPEIRDDGTDTSSGIPNMDSAAGVDVSDSIEGSTEPTDDRDDEQTERLDTGDSDDAVHATDEEAAAHTREIEDTDEEPDDWTEADGAIANEDGIGIDGDGEPVGREDGEDDEEAEDTTENPETDASDADDDDRDELELEFEDDEGDEAITGDTEDNERVQTADDGRETADDGEEDGDADGIESDEGDDDVDVDEDSESAVAKGETNEVARENETDEAA